MAGIESLLKAYERAVALPRETGLAGPQKVWFAVYNPLEERRLRYRIRAYEVSTNRAGYAWKHLDLTDLFPQWMAAHEYREAYFESPDLMEMALQDFTLHAAAALRQVLTSRDADERAVVAVSGLASLFGLTRFSSVLNLVELSIRGRLLVFFPGEQEGASYRLLGSRDGWSYHAIPITAQEGPAPMTTNREVFTRDPLQSSIPNDGVAKVVEPQTKEQWDVLRYELESFVCEGEYERGLERILSSFLRSLGTPVQPAVWISGFYGSGKSHLARMLEFVWRNVSFPDGATARGLVTLPGAIQEHLKELTLAGKREGGLWSAAGTLGAGDKSVRLSFLAILFTAAGLPEHYAPARLVLMLKQNGEYEAVKAHLEVGGHDVQRELRNMFVSTALAAALCSGSPSFSGGPAAVRDLLKLQFPPVTEITDSDFIQALKDVLALQSTVEGKYPCTLIVLDELQQFIGESPDRTLQVQTLVEACTAAFGSRILFLATGQSALQATPQLAKLQGRFTVQVALSDTDVEKVVREVVLRKKSACLVPVRDVMENCSGEIDRHLGGSEIAAAPSDRPVWVADYPLLPTRRRFWEKVLHAVDRGGMAAQLRTQLRIVHEANREVAEDPLGVVVGGDYIYRQLVPSMLQSGTLLPEVDVMIRQQAKDGTADGFLRERLCAAIFLVSQLPTGTETGVRPTADTLADLLVQDLNTGSAALRQRIPALLAGLVDAGTLMQVGEQFLLQTREGADWEGQYRSRYARISNDDGRIASERTTVLREACDSALKGLAFLQGKSKTPRKTEVHFGMDDPGSGSGSILLWIRDEWSVSLKTVREDAQAAGTDSPVVYVFLPQAGVSDGLKRALAGLAAASETLQARPSPSTREGEQAKAGMLTREAQQKRLVRGHVDTLLREARVLQGGGSEVTAADWKEAVRSAAESALARLYPGFDKGDDPRWTLAGARARQGNGSPLEALDYTGEDEKHPVCVQVLTYIGQSEKKGAEIRAHFTAPPFGWPKDTVDGALFVLTASGRLRASRDGVLLTAKQIDQGELGPLGFRAEGVTVTLIQRIGVRKLFGEAGIKYQNNEESQSIPAYLETLTTLARAAGGESPLPAPPSTLVLEELKVRLGNDQAAAVYDERDRLSADLKEWKARKAASENRLPRWAELERLLRHAEKLPIHDQAAPEIQAIRANRSLLAEPDPTTPLCAALARELRARLQAARDEYLTSRAEKLDALLFSPAWKALESQPALRQPILERSGLNQEADPKVGTDAELLRALNSTPLSLWKERTAALSQNIAAALLEAEQLAAPTAVHVTLPNASLKTPEEVETYLSGIRALLLEHIEAGRPVVV